MDKPKTPEEIAKEIKEIGSNVVDYFYMVDKWGAKNETECMGIWRLIHKAISAERNANLEKIKALQAQCEDSATALIKRHERILELEREIEMLTDNGDPLI